jgi:hypothetical protein
MSTKQLDDLLATLPRERQPERDLWPEIAARLAPRRQSRHFGKLAIAASVLLMLLFSWQWPERTEPVLAWQQQEQQWQQALSQQLAELQQVNPAFGDWQWQLQLWQQAINQVKVALNFYPDDPGLQHKLASLYQQQLSYVDWLASTSY